MISPSSDAEASKVVLLTGASRGIGLATAHHLLQQPASHRLILLARSECPLRNLEAQYGSSRIAVIAGDLSTNAPALAAKAIEVARTRFDNRLDGLILNHGVLAPVARIAEVEIDSWRRAWETNFFSCVALVQAALPLLRESVTGCILLTSSGAAVGSYTGWGAYGAAKAAVNHLARTLGVEEKGVVTLAIRPGVVDTEMQREIRERHHEYMDAKDVEKFRGLKERGGLLRPEQPGHVMARLVVRPPKELSGNFVDWNSEDLREYQS
ncbi:hypothetical protein M433DRAFT_159911 [Acidomyces richmondensis BFW]|nr:MAG: hypothetical protein FE78DRAFT_90097 [Acidomyces sp. 'richmondensis']KYG40786.1 hypothetical protein M433DRAFT_159911 [Acidomyces richmondensis BFW]